MSIAVFSFASRFAALTQRRPSHGYCILIARLPITSQMPTRLSKLPDRKSLVSRPLTVHATSLSGPLQARRRRPSRSSASRVPHRVTGVREPERQPRTASTATTGARTPAATAATRASPAGVVPSTSHRAQPIYEQSISYSQQSDHPQVDLPEPARSFGFPMTSSGSSAGTGFPWPLTRTLHVRSLARLWSHSAGRQKPACGGHPLDIVA